MNYVMWMLASLVNQQGWGCELLCLIIGISLLLGDGMSSLAVTRRDLGDGAVNQDYVSKNQLSLLLNSDLYTSLTGLSIGADGRHSGCFHFELCPLWALSDWQRVHHLDVLFSFKSLKVYLFYVRRRSETQGLLLEHGIWWLVQERRPWAGTIFGFPAHLLQDQVPVLIHLLILLTSAEGLLLTLDSQKSSLGIPIRFNDKLQVKVEKVLPRLLLLSWEPKRPLEFGAGQGPFLFHGFHAKSWRAIIRLIPIAW